MERIYSTISIGKMGFYKYTWKKETLQYEGVYLSLV